MKIDAEKIIDDLQYSADYFAKLHKEMKLDAEYSFGRQWKNEDVETLRRIGVKALTINKIRSRVNILTGLERQSKSDYKAFPEGEEDSLKAEVMTRVFKNVAKQAELQRKTSEQFDTGVRVGLGFLQAYIDRTFDLITGELKFKHIDPMNVYPDPAAKEATFFDGQYIAIVSPDLTKDQLISLFPQDKRERIEKLAPQRLEIDKNIQEYSVRAKDRYKSDRNDAKTLDAQDLNDDLYDLVDYYYKKLETRYFVADQVLGTLIETEKKAEAEQYVAENEGAVLIAKDIPEIRLARYVSGEIIEDERSEFYPEWKHFPIFSFVAEQAHFDVPSELRFQGIVRSMRDLNDEFNKRRVQELRHLNSTVNSGWWIPKRGGMSTLNPQDKAKLTKLGSSPGFIGEYDAEIGPPTRTTPTPLSQGHSQLAAETDMDMKEVSGVNIDLLANDSQSQSGRAILLKQRQGLVMVQGILDNYGNTKKKIGEFIVSQLKNLFTPETAIRVLGNTFIEDQIIFKAPVHEIVDRAKQKQAQGIQLSPFEAQVARIYPEVTAQKPAVDQNGQPVITTDQDAVFGFMSQMLNDVGLTKYDVTIGEGAFTETVRMADFGIMQELAQGGIPIPPELFVTYSQLPEAAKNSIINAIQAQRQAPPEQAQQRG